VRILRLARNWVTTIPTLLAFGLTLAIGDVVLRIVRLFGIRPMEWAVAVLQRMLIWSFRLSGMRLEVERPPGLEPGEGYVIVANHQSIFDIPLIGGTLLTNFPKYVSKAELGRGIPMVSYNLRRGDNCLIDRSDPRGATAAITQFGERVQQRGVSAVIFPEGSRSRDGRLKTFKRSGTEALIAAADRLPVVPAVIDGSWRLLVHKMFPIPFGTRVRIRFLEPIARTEDDDPAEILDECRAQIEATLAAWQPAMAAG
jgi:1-acyl-sn-glycerol-3-phosphate acyltransferase